MSRNSVVFSLPLVILIGLAAYFYFSGEASAPGTETLVPPYASSEPTNMIIIETSKGVIKAELRADDAPKTAKNFQDLVARKFYDGLTFHRVEPNFVIQGGDPKGDGTGGSETSIPLELKCEDGTMHEGETVTCPVALPHKDGALAMARTMDPNSATSQFYITIGEQAFLNGNYAVFGYVTEGFDVVRTIQRGDIIKKISFE